MLRSVDSLPQATAPPLIPMGERSPGSLTHTTLSTTPTNVSPNSLLVSYTSNSRSPTSQRGSQAESCPDSRLIQATCRDHSVKRFITVPCKLRGCETCGPISRYTIAQRIAYGVRAVMKNGQRCAWLVLTFTDDQLTGDPAIDKPAAVRHLARFIRWLRTTQAMPDLAYVATYELGDKTQRFHINLIAGPWRFIDSDLLRVKWGARLSVEWVEDSGGMGREAAKTYSPESLGNYVSKLEQAVPRDWSRRVSYSRNWPKLPPQAPVRVGLIDYALPEIHVAVQFDLPHIFPRSEVAPGEWVMLQDQILSRYSGCSCFDLIDQSGTVHAIVSPMRSVLF